MVTLPQIADSINALRNQLQTRLERPSISNETLAKMLKTKGLSESTLRQVCAGDYAAKDLNRLKLSFEQAARRIRAQHGLLSSGSGPSAALDCPEWFRLQTAVNMAIKNSRNGSPRKLVFFLGEPGFGKTTSAARLVAKYSDLDQWRTDQKTWVETVVPKDRREPHLEEIGTSQNAPAVASSVTARESWHDSYFSPLKSLATACGVTATMRNAQQAETALFDSLQSERSAAWFRPRILCLDEVEFCGKKIVNLWKLLMNDTPLVLVIFCQPKFFDDFSRLGGLHTDQLTQRCIDVIRCGQITAPAARQILFSALGDYGDLDVDSATLSTCANGSDIGGPDPRNKAAGFRLCAEVAAMMASSGMKLEGAISAFRHAQGIRTV